jgi:hypothetical protein
MQSTDNVEKFWSDTYHGHTIAVFNHGGSWLAYLDHALQPRMLFVTAEAAVAWLRQRIDGLAAPKRGVRARVDGIA